MSLSLRRLGQKPKGAKAVGYYGLLRRASCCAGVGWLQHIVSSFNIHDHASRVAARGKLEAPV
jgi:hypothetical protein